MKLQRLHLSGFQSFAPDASPIDFEPMSFLIGPNGAGKTAVLTALARMFGTDPAMRQIVRSDFHVGADEEWVDGTPASLWLEADFVFPEARDGDDPGVTVPAFFLHMRLQEIDGEPRMRVRLSADIDAMGEVDQRLEYVLLADHQGVPVQTRSMSRAERQAIQVHYLPARRDPGTHISYAAGSILGRMLRSADWTAQRAAVADLGVQVSDALGENAGVGAVVDALQDSWSTLHKGHYYKAPALSFARGELEEVLRHVKITFGPGPGEPAVDFARLSDGQKSLLYLSLVLAAHSVGKSAAEGEETPFDIDILKPPVFTLFAMEEPENSLSPHYLGRVVDALKTLAASTGGQAVVATHAPSMLKRVEPALIRYLRLNAERETQVREIVMPDDDDVEAAKFVREAVMVFPELYFSRLVILGEGDSEEIVLPRLLAARGINADGASVCIAPLGGRHVQHFWRLLSVLEIPFVTLLDLDLGRFGGGWGRVRVTHKHLRTFPAGRPTKRAAVTNKFPKWNDAGMSQALSDELAFLETADVFFSRVVDLDMAMIRQFPGAYGIDEEALKEPHAATIRAVLGKNGNIALLNNKQTERFFYPYHRRFKLSSKPVSHIKALANLDDADLSADMPPSLGRMIDRVEVLLDESPE
ncbi:putative ATP-dependent endonuclease of OLD family [Luteibacter sp. 621]|uniref:AAA family ATPase n=1 Tax=Luteibacter sp. 621 TaxID=3373916 RepID=UPI003D2113EB